MDTLRNARRGWRPPQQKVAAAFRVMRGSSTPCGSEDLISSVLSDDWGDFGLGGRLSGIDHPTVVRHRLIDRFQHLHDSQAGISIVDRSLTAANTLNEVFGFRLEGFDLFNPRHP